MQHNLCKHLPKVTTSYKCWLAYYAVLHR